MQDSRADFWNKKIARWDDNRYSPKWFQALAARPIQRRLLGAAEVALELAREGDSVLDAGCGTGRLLELLPADRSLRYVGLDFSAHAIEIARRRATSRDGSLPRHEFFCADTSKSLGRFDGLIALGFSDWVSDGELLTMLEQAKPRWAVVSFTLRRPFDPYSMYRRWADRNGTNYRARTFSESEAHAILTAGGLSVVKVLRNGVLSPGTTWVAKRSGA